MKSLNLIFITLLISSCSYYGLIEPPADIDIHFCDQEDCLALLEGMINSSYSVHCALYDYNHEFYQALQKADARFVSNKGEKARRVKLYGLMHNKFCILNGRIVTTGSFNPTRRKSNDDLVVIRSKIVSSAYEDEFQELWTHNFRHSVFNKQAGLRFYFCPEDNCADAIISEIKKARKRIYFMAYSFTSRGIAVNLILAKQRGVEIKGIVDSSQVNDYSVVDFLKSNKINVKESRELFHYKVFIIDDSTVITGSYNPTKNAKFRNKENILIIKNQNINNLYIKKFMSYYSNFKNIA